MNTKYFRYSEIYMGPANLTGMWMEETLCEYFAHVRTFKPELTEEAKKILSASYLYHRSDPYRRPERTTVRLLDSLIRYIKQSSNQSSIIMIRMSCYLS